MKITGLKRSKYQIDICNEFGNVMERMKLSEKDFYGWVESDTNNNILFKAYIGGALYCHHEKLR